MPILSIEPLDFVWKTLDPFLFCVHHDDSYPSGNAAMGPNASLVGRNIGQDFAGKDGWRMYHGTTVPGFPAHPHRGFETVTLMRSGFIDHSDSLGATARFGEGDVQWMTAGKGIVHCEMFPLRNQKSENPAELFQIWLNLPAADKMAPPHFAMLWNDEIPSVQHVDSQGKTTLLRLVSGQLGNATPPSPPPRSWATRAEAEVAIWTLKCDSGAVFELPPAEAGLNRMLYLFRGTAKVANRALSGKVGIRLVPTTQVQLEAGPEGAQFLLLQGKPIAEPVVAHGPFVMNTQAEIHQAFADYQRTRFGGWPWGKPDPVHPRDQGRFARHADGRIEVREPARPPANALPPGGLQAAALPESAASDPLALNRSLATEAPPLRIGNLPPVPPRLRD